MRLSIRNSALIILLVAFIHGLPAQQNQHSPAAFELWQAKRLWHQSTNASGSLIDNPYQYSLLNAGYLFYGGDFHRPQEGKSGSELSVHTEGVQLLKRLYTWGSFNYTQEDIAEAGYNTSLINPYRGMPYIVADTNLSQWLKQHYDLRFKVATVQSSNFSFGLEGIYNASIGAKQRDVRTKNQLYLLQLKPGMTYSINKSHHIGLSADFFSLKEESRNSNVNTYIDQKYYELYGLGTAVESIGSGRTTNYTGYNFGGGIQYNYKGDINLMVEGTYDNKKEDVQVSFSTPKPDAMVDDTRIRGKITLFTTKSDLTHYFSGSFSNRLIDGTQHLTQFNNAIDQRKWVIVSSSIRSKYKTTNINTQYDLIKERSDEYSWKAGLGVSYTSVNDAYLLPHSYKKAKNLLFNIHGKKNFFLSNLLSERLLIGMTLEYKHNLSGAYLYSGQNPDYPSVKDLEKPDLEYLISDYQAAEFAATYSRKLNAEKKTNLYLELNFRYINTSDFNYNNRYFGQIKFGAHF